MEILTPFWLMMSTPTFTPYLVDTEPSPLDTSKSPGAVQLHPYLLKWLATFFVEPLVDFFEKLPSDSC